MSFVCWQAANHDQAVYWYERDPITDRWICYDNDSSSPCSDSLCVKTKGNANCPSGWSQVWNTNRCKDNSYESCINGSSKNIYKDYNYGCELSMASQSNLILSVIDSIWKYSSSLTNMNYNWLRIFWFRIY